MESQAGFFSRLKWDYLGGDLKFLFFSCVFRKMIQFDYPPVN